MTAADKGAATVDFGATEDFGAHRFRVEISASRGDPVRIVEDYGYAGGEGRPYEEVRAIVDRRVWTAVAEAARVDFNDRLKTRRMTTGRWRSPHTLVERLLGKELCVLVWAAEHAHEDLLPVVCTRWSALRPEERWWLFGMTVAEAGTPEDGDRGWRRALRDALQDGSRMTAEERKKRAPRPDAGDPQASLPLFER